MSFLFYLFKYILEVNSANSNLVQAIHPAHRNRIFSKFFSIFQKFEKIIKMWAALTSTHPSLPLVTFVCDRLVGFVRRKLLKWRLWVEVTEQCGSDVLN